MRANNVTRFLDAHQIEYTLFELSTEKHSAVETAHLLGVEAEQVFKTIVVTREGRGKTILAVVPGPVEVDLKALASTVGEKKLSLPTEREAEQITGLQAGGISPLALLNRGFQVVIDETAGLFDQIHVSAGERGLNLRLSPQDLIELTRASQADISKWR
jgi:Cys-tRNA(Pro)/Cys-tRNA(Cys) deacylase